MGIGFLITARLKSTRLPGKITLELNNKPVIWHMINRLKMSSVLDRIVICTSINPDDKPLVDIAMEENIDYFLGSEEDVILRLYEAAKEFNLDYVLNITADCPLVSFEHFDTMVNKYLETDADLIRNMQLPIGLFSYGLKVAALRKVCEIKKSGKTEVWGRYFTDTGLFNVVDVDVSPEYIRPDYRFTLDYPEDFDFLKKIYSHFGENTYKTSSLDIIRYLDENPQIVAINHRCDELYRERWESQNKLAQWEI